MQRVNSPKTFIFSSVLAAALMLAWALPASAQVTFLFDKDQYIANHPDQLVQTFAAGNVAPGNFENCIAPVNEFSSDDCFSPGDIIPGLEFTSSPFDENAIFLAGIHLFGASNPRNALGLGGGAGTMDVLFLGGVNSAGLNLGCFVEGPDCSTTLTIRIFDVNDVLLNAVQVDSTDEFNTFLGFDSTVPLARVNISGPIQNVSQAVDEVRFGNSLRNIPTLSEWGMIAAFVGLGLIGVYFAVRRKKRSMMQDA